MGTHAPHPVEGAPARLRAPARRRANVKLGDVRSTSRWGNGSATWWSRPTRCAKGYDDRVLMEDLSFSLPRGGIVGVIGAERAEDAVPDGHRAGGAGRRRAAAG